PQVTGHPRLVSAADAEMRRGRGRYCAPIVRLSIAKKTLAPLFAHIVPDGLAVFWDIGVEIDQVDDFIRHHVRNATDNHSAIRMPTQDKLIEVLPLDYIQNVLNVGV